MYSVLLLVTLFAVSLAYPDGAPTDACATLTPQHEEHTRQTAAAPFIISTDADNYVPGSAVTITIENAVKNSDNRFKGFIAVARQVGSSANEGEFAPSDDNSKTIDCSAPGDAITHANAEDKSAITFLWQPAENFKGQIIFTATIVQAFDTYWTGVKSNTIEFN